MIPAAFDYIRATSIDEAISMLVEHGDDAKLLAGGHSLIPLLRLRFARPALLIDLGPLAELDYVRDEGDHVALGALTRYRSIETSPLLAARVGLLPAVVHYIGDPQVRHRGTVGGSICHGDAAADLPAALVALDATFVVRGPGGTREVAAGDFFQGFLETALAPDELLTEIKVPTTSTRFAFEKFNRRAPDWAIVGCAVAAPSGPGRAGTRVALVNMASVPVRALGVEGALANGATIADAASHADEESDPPSDANATAEYRRHLARVLVRRALERAFA